MVCSFPRAADVHGEEKQPTDKSPLSYREVRFNNAWAGSEERHVCPGGPGHPQVGYERSMETWSSRNSDQGRHVILGQLSMLRTFNCGTSPIACGM